VLIENQLERTDHNHLGQLLTYAAGLDAVTVVWVAARFTEEHRAALDWLNNATTSEFNFFGLEIELWRIGDSPMAPKFNVVSKPNDWSKSIREQAGHTGELTPAQRVHLDFWTQFRQYLDDRGSPIRTTKPSKDHWSNVAVGRSNFTLSPFNNTRENRSTVHLQITGPNRRAYFRLIEQRHKDQVDEKLSPFGTVLWRPLPTAKESQIGVTTSSTPSNRDTWPELNDWMATALETMHALFSPIVKTLDAADYVEPEEVATDEEDVGAAG
jgi:hypothetical protein